jgi:beta-galactosidase
MIWSNCGTIKAYLDGAHLATLTPDTAGYPHLAYPPFYLDVSHIDGSDLPELRLDGYVGDRLALSRSFAADPSGDRLDLITDNGKLVADGSDATRVVFRAVDRFGAPRPYVTGNVTVSVQGPAIWLGQVLNLDVAPSPVLVPPGRHSTVSITLANGGFPFAANGGVGGIWIRTMPNQPGKITVRVTHPTLGPATARITATAPPAPLPGQNPPGGQQADPQQRMSFTGIVLSLSLPDGWSATPSSPTRFPALAPGSSVTSSWEVTAPAKGRGGSGTATASFTLDGSQVSQSTDVPVALATSMANSSSNSFE